MQLDYISGVILYIEKDGKKLRCGYTTGACAAAASKAALLMLLGGEEIYNVNITTPKGVEYSAELVDISIGNGSISCAVIKDAGDDPDITNGAKIYSRVSLRETPGIEIEGGIGVGRITKPGLDQPVGEAAINSVPRKMIRENLEEVLNDYGIKTGLSVEISVPVGMELAEKTFNPKLGIVGGISILGTTGIVEPMSDNALLDTIKVEIRVRKEEGRSVLLVAPGNYGMTFLQEKYGIESGIAVMCSNFVYDTVRMAVDTGFNKLLFAGHIGKLIKVAGGIKNTHSRYGDHRMEILSEICSEFSDGRNYARLRNKLGDCVMTDEAVRIIREEGIEEQVFGKMAGSIKSNIESWAEHKLEAQIIVFSNENTELVQTEGAKQLLEEF